MSSFLPVTKLSNFGILIENCLDDNEVLLSKYSKLPVIEETRMNGDVIGSKVYLYAIDDNTKKLYKEMHDIMIKSTSIFLDQENKNIDDYKIDSDHYKIFTWAPPQPMMASHADQWEIKGVMHVPAITTLLYLSSDYEGGNLIFPEHNIIFKPKAGDMVSFFSNTQHEVSAVTSGRRITTQLFLFNK